MNKTCWTELSIINVRTQELVTELQERLRILRLYRQIGYANGFVIKAGDGVARIDSIAWAGFTWE